LAETLAAVAAASADAGGNGGASASSGSGHGGSKFGVSMFGGLVRCSKKELVTLCFFSSLGKTSIIFTAYSYNILEFNAPMIPAKT
jgi:hypothetical protein